MTRQEFDAHGHWDGQKFVFDPPLEVVPGITLNHIDFSGRTCDDPEQQRLRAKLAQQHPEPITLHGFQLGAVAEGEP